MCRFQNRLIASGNLLTVVGIYANVNVWFIIVQYIPQKVIFNSWSILFPGFSNHTVCFKISSSLSTWSAGRSVIIKALDRPHVNEFHGSYVTQSPVSSEFVLNRKAQYLCSTHCTAVLCSCLNSLNSQRTLRELCVQCEHTSRFYCLSL